MTPHISVRRGAALAVTLAAVPLTLAVPAPTAAAPAGPGPATGPAAAAPVDRTTVTFKVRDCEGCEFQLHQGVEVSTGEGDPDYQFWSSKQKKVRGGEVSWRIPSTRTYGMSATVRAPWEGHTGYLTTVAFRYGKEEVGSRVDLEKARGKHRATACFAGTDDDELTRVVRVRRVPVEGVHGRVLGSIAFTTRTQPWTAPMRKAWGGILGSQEINLCGA